jgi:hypothetical protein
MAVTAAPAGQDPVRVVSSRETSSGDGQVKTKSAPSDANELPQSLIRRALQSHWLAPS